MFRGTGWGEAGFIRLKRGVGMCGVGSVIVVAKCDKSEGAISAPLTTAKPCVDKYSNCPTLAKTNCYSFGESCAKVSQQGLNMVCHTNTTTFTNSVLSPELR